MRWEIFKSFESAKSSRFVSSYSEIVCRVLVVCWWSSRSSYSCCPVVKLFCWLKVKCQVFLLYHFLWLSKSQALKPCPPLYWLMNLMTQFCFFTLLVWFQLRCLCFHMKTYKQILWQVEINLMTKVSSFRIFKWVFYFLKITHYFPFCSVLYFLPSLTNHFIFSSKCVLQIHWSTCSNFHLSSIISIPH